MKFFKSKDGKLWEIRSRILFRNSKYGREFRFEDHRYGQEKTRCICDFVVDGKIVLEFKAKDYITKDDYYQTQRYLSILNLELAVIVNFRQKRLVPKRVLNSRFIDYYSGNS